MCTSTQVIANRLYLTTDMIQQVKLTNMTRKTIIQIIKTFYSIQNEIPKYNQNFNDCQQRDN